MSDKLLPVAGVGTANQVPKRLRDAGNGTYAEVVSVIEPMAIPDHDYIACTYTGTNLTKVEYYTGGSGGTKVATLTLAYNGSDQLTSVTRS